MRGRPGVQGGGGDPDLVVIDYSINDRASGQDWLTTSTAAPAARRGRGRDRGDGALLTRRAKRHRGRARRGARAQSRARAARTSVSRSATACLSSRTSAARDPPGRARPRGRRRAHRQPPAARAHADLAFALSRWWCALARALDARRAGRAAADGAARARARAARSRITRSAARSPSSRAGCACARGSGPCLTRRAAAASSLASFAATGVEKSRGWARGAGARSRRATGDRVSGAATPPRAHRVHALVRVVGDVVVSCAAAGRTAAAAVA